MAEKSFEFGSLHVHSDQPFGVDPHGRNHVVDGDTIVVGGERWRLFGWDAPPITGNCCDVEADKGQRAKEYLEQLMRWGAATGELRIDVRNVTEKYRRRLVSIYVNDHDIGRLMADADLAKPYNGRGEKPAFCDCSERRQLKAAIATYDEAKKRQSLRHRLSRIRSAIGA